MKNKQRLVLLDAHAILHKAYHALPDFVSEKGEPTGAIYGLVSMILALIDELKPDYIVACYDLPGPTYRHDAYKEYKAGRAKADEALVHQMKRSRDVFTAFNIPIYDKPGFEADDMLGTIVEKVKNNKNLADIDVVIASGDMDTMQLIDGKRVQVFTLKKGIKDTIMYDEKAVLERFGFGPELLPDYKGLRGDPSDNIIGIKGIGEKTATSLIRAFGGIDGIYKALKKDKTEDKSEFKKACEEKGGGKVTDRIIKLIEEGEEDAEFSRMLATIRRDAPIDFVLPEKTFKESINTETANKLFTELTFRTFSERLKRVLSGESLIQKNDAQKIQVESEKEVEVEIFAGVPEEDIFKLGIALWILNSNITKPTKEDISEFTKTKDFEKSKEIIEGELKKQDLWKIYEKIELPLWSVIKKMEKKGVKIDKLLLKDLSSKYHEVLDGLQKKIWILAGVEFNINSPKQIGEVLFDKLMLTAKGLKKTEGGARSTKESELEKLSSAHPVVPLILEYREYQKLLSTYIDTIPTLLDENDRLHAKFMQTGTTTGRMASIDPNIQNIPIKTDLGRAIRHAFIAEKGFVVATFDYSQIELRIAAFLSGDQKLIEIFKNGVDVHTAVASEVFGVPIEKVDREMRRRAKVINFGILYGMGVNALRQNLDSGAGVDENGEQVKVKREEAQVFYNNYFEKFSGLSTYLDKVKAEAERKGYTETFFGRRRYFEGIKSPIPYVKAMAERMAINAPIQGTSADIIKLAMIEIDKYVSENNLSEQVYLVMQVHDELVFEIKDEVKDSVSKKIENIMKNVLSKEETQGIELAVSYDFGKNWGDLK